MKKLLFLLPTLCISWLSLSADTFTEGDFTYKTTGSTTVTMTATSLANTTTKVTIPNTVTHDGTTYQITEIGSRVFYQFTKLYSITFTTPSYLKKIGERAFYKTGQNSSSYTLTLTIPEGIEELGEYCFWNATYGYQINIPSTLRVIPGSAFGAWNYSSFNKFNVDANNPYFTVYSNYVLCNKDQTKVIAVSAYKCPTSLPATIDTIGKYALGWLSASNYSSITIPANVKYIEDYAFYGCKRTISFASGSQLLEIGKYAFGSYAYASSTNIDLRNATSLTKIGDYAFQNCTTNVTYIVLPPNLQYLGKNAFDGANGLTNIYIGESTTTGQNTCNGYYCTVDGALYNADKSKLIYYPAKKSTATVSLPEGLVTIPAKAFQGNTSIKNVTLPSSIDTIYDYAFYKCTNCTTVVVPDGVKYIGNHVWEQCKALTSMTIPASVTHIGTHALDSCLALTTVVMNNTMTEIPEATFRRCTTLNNVTIAQAESLTSIGKQAFDSCLVFKGFEGKYNDTDREFTLPSQLTTIKEAAFKDCKVIRTPVFPTTLKTIENKAFYCTSTYRNSYFNHLTLPDGVEYIGDYAFMKCNYSFYKIGNSTPYGTFVIPNSVTYLGKAAFYYNSYLRKVQIGTGITELQDSVFSNCGLTKVVIPNNVTKLGKYCFAQCSSISSVQLPNQITEIPDYAFYYCSNSNWSTIALPSSIVRIGKSAFYYNNFKSIVLPSSLKIIDSQAFRNSSYLENVTFGDGLETIGDSAFYNCQKIKTLAFPGNLQTIGERAFAECKALKFATCLATTPPQCKSTSFYNINYKDSRYNNGTLCVAREKLAEYKKSQYYWTSGWNIQELYTWSPVKKLDELTDGTPVVMVMEDHAGNRYVLKFNAPSASSYSNAKLVSTNGMSVMDYIAAEGEDGMVITIKEVKPHEDFSKRILHFTTNIGNTTYYIHENHQSKYGSSSYSYYTFVDCGTSASAYNETSHYYNIYKADNEGHFYIRNSSETYFDTDSKSYKHMYPGIHWGYYTHSSANLLHLTDGSLFDASNSYPVYKTYYRIINQWETGQTLDEATPKEINTSTTAAMAWTFYRKLSTYIATFDANGKGSFGGAQTKIIADAAVELPSVQANDGYIFTGWNTRADGTGTPIPAGDGYIQLTQDTVLYAQYEANKSNWFTVLGWKENAIVIKTTQNIGSADVQVVANATYNNWLFGTPLTLVHDDFNLCKITGDVGMYTLPINKQDLLDNQGCALLLTLYDKNGNQIGIASLPIPALINRNTNISNFTPEFCESNDFYVLKNGVLTINENRTMRDIHVQGAGRLVIPAGQILTAKNICLRGGDDENGAYFFRYPEMVVNGNIAAGCNIAYEYMLNHVQYYPISVPYDVNLDEITYLDGKPMVRGYDGFPSGQVYQYKIQYYDGEQRSTGTTGWKTLDASATKLEVGKGYTIFVKPQIVYVGGVGAYQHYAFIRMPLHADFSTLNEQSKIVTTTKPGFSEGGLNPGVKPNDAGWNLMGNPYLANFQNPDGLADNAIGLLVFGAGGYEWVDDARYVVVPSNDGKDYEQYLTSETNLYSFKNFFMQIGNGDAIVFNIANRAQKVVARQEQREQEVTTGIILTQVATNTSDRMGLLIGDNYSDEFEFNADLGKLSHNAKRVTLYAWWNDAEQSFLALNENSLNSIPVGFDALQNGTYRFSLDTAYTNDRLEVMDLYDSQTGKVTDLLHNDYEFTAIKGNNHTRFTLSLRLSGKTTPTTLPSVINGTTGTQIYDILGRKTAIQRQGVYIYQSQDGTTKLQMR